MDVETENFKIVADYTGLNFEQLMELDIYTYKLLFKDAYIYNLKQTEEGREYLKECYTLTLTEPDRNTLRQMFGGEHK